MTEPKLDTLEHDVLLHVLSQLDDPKDLTTAGQVSKRLYDASQSPSLWRSMVSRKWFRPSHNSWPQGAWRTIFATNNGLLDTDVHTHVMDLPTSSCTSISCIATGDQRCLVAVGSGTHVDLVSLQTTIGSSPSCSAEPAPQQPHSTGAVRATHNSGWCPTAHQQIQLPAQRDASAICWSPDGRQLLVGTLQGSLHCYQCSHSQPPAHSPDTATQEPRWATQQQVRHDFPSTRGLPVSDILQVTADPAVVGLGSRVAVLYDHMWASSRADAAPPAAPVCNSIDIYQAETPYTHLGSLRDCMDGWQVMCMVRPQSTSLDLVVGSVAGPCCRHCWESATPWLCHHKQPAAEFSGVWSASVLSGQAVEQARCAALCVADLRTPLGLTARYALHHRSLYPRLATARDHWVFTSHADRPLCVWDLRRMSVPLFEQDRLDHLARGPLGLGSLPAEHQALWLTADSDVLVGRADNGCLWVWDLAALLGWADGSGVGWWEALDEVPSWCAPELKSSTGWPRCVGTLPLGTAAIPATHLTHLDGALGVLALTCAPDWGTERGGTLLGGDTRAKHANGICEGTADAGQQPAGASQNPGAVSTTALPPIRGAAKGGDRECATLQHAGGSEVGPACHRQLGEQAFGALGHTSIDSQWLNRGDQCQQQVCDTTDAAQQPARCNPTEQQEGQGGAPLNMEDGGGNDFCEDWSVHGCVHGMAPARVHRYAWCSSLRPGGASAGASGQCSGTWQLLQAPAEQYVTAGQTATGVQEDTEEGLVDDAVAVMVFSSRTRVV